MSHRDNVFFGHSASFPAVLGIFAVAVYFIAQPVMAAEDAAGGNTMLTQAVEENIKPVGTVIVGDEAAAGADEAAAAAAPRSGEEVFNSACMACHATGAAGAPKVGDTAAWAPRIAQGMDTLVLHSINGLNAMPPRGTCADCSDEDLKAAVTYMVERSQ